MANSINEICVNLYILSSALRLRFGGVSAYCTRGQARRVSLPSIGIWRALNYCTRLDCAGTSKTMSVLRGNGEMPIIDLLSLLRNQRTARRVDTRYLAESDAS